MVNNQYNVGSFPTAILASKGITLEDFEACLLGDGYAFAHILR